MLYDGRPGVVGRENRTPVLKRWRRLPENSGSDRVPPRRMGRSALRIGRFLLGGGAPTPA